MAKWLDEYGREVGEASSLAHLDGAGIRDLLRERGITEETAKPVYKEREFTPTEHCRAWRQTAGCTALGERETMADAACDEMIQSGQSGYCECTTGKRVEFDCGHTQLTCEEACKNPPQKEQNEGASSGEL
eukprot:Hpha_TRINITY_DN12931_c0_g1::TRINITY_DN12931_c0_g1_i1::g.164262::m.164262